MTEASKAQNHHQDLKKSKMIEMKMANADLKADIQRLKKRRQLFALLPMFLIQFGIGMHAGFPAILTPQLKDACSDIKVGDDEESWIVSLDDIASTTLCMIFGIMQHKLGPKKVLMIACLPYCSGWLLTGFGTSVLYLYGARLMVGMGHGIALSSVYTLEVTSTEMRASFSLIESIVRGAGCLVPYSLGAFLDWKMIAQGAALIPLMALIMVIFTPESPTFLVRKGKIEAAKDSLRCLFGSSYNVDDHILKIRNGLLNSHRLDEGEEKKPLKVRIGEKLIMMKSPEVARPFVILLLLSIVEQFSGMTIFRAYVVKIFNTIFAYSPPINGTMDPTLIVNCTDHTPVGVRVEAYYSAIILGTVRLVALSTLSTLVRNVPRRKMYLTSLTATAISLLGVATFSCILANFDLEPSLSTTLKWCTLAASAALAFSVQLGVQSLPSLLSGELFPSELRAFCKSICCTFSGILLVLSLKSFPLLENSITFYGTFYLMAAVMVSSIPLVYTILPETKDVQLEMIQHIFKKQKTIFQIELDPGDLEKDANPSGAQKTNEQLSANQNLSDGYI